MSNSRAPDSNHCYPYFGGASAANPSFIFNNLKKHIPRNHPEFKLQTITQLRTIFSYIESKILKNKEFNTWQIELSFSSPVEAPPQPKIYLEEGITMPPPGSPESEGNDNIDSMLPVLQNDVLSILAGCEADKEPLRSTVLVTPKAQRIAQSGHYISPLTEASKGMKTTPSRKRSKPEHIQTCHTDLAPRSKVARETIPNRVSSNLVHSGYLMPGALAGLESDQSRIQATEKKLLLAQQDLLARKSSELGTNLTNLPKNRHASDLSLSLRSAGPFREADSLDLRSLRPYNSVQSHGQSNSLLPPKASSKENLITNRSKASPLKRGHSHHTPGKRGLARFDSLIDRASDDLEPCWSSQPDPSPIASPVGSPLLDSSISRSNSYTSCPANAARLSIDNSRPVPLTTNSGHKRKLSRIMPRPKLVDLNSQGSTSDAVQKACISDPSHPSSPPPSN